MTTLAAIHVPGKGTHIGSDSLTTIAGKKTVMRGWKWSVYDNRAVGVSGLLAMNVLIQKYTKELLEDVEGPFEFGQRLLEVANAHKWTFSTPGEENGGPPCIPASLLMATGDGLWTLDPTLAHMEVPHNEIIAAGSGMDYAIGAGAAVPKMPPARRLITAIEVACSFDIYSGGDIKTGFLPATRTNTKH